MKEALKDLLEAMEAAIKAGDWKVDGACDPDSAIQRARKALALQALHDENERLGLYKDAYEQPEQEPVAHFGSAYVNENGVHITTVLGPVAIPQDAKLYTTPPYVATPRQRTWVGLDEEDDIDWEEGGSLRDLVEAVEAKLKEKNNGT